MKRSKFGQWHHYIPVHAEEFSLLLAPYPDKPMLKACGLLWFIGGMHNHFLPGSMQGSGVDFWGDSHIFIFFFGLSRSPLQSYQIQKIENKFYTICGVLLGFPIQIHTGRVGGAWCGTSGRASGSPLWFLASGPEVSVDDLSLLEPSMSGLSRDNHCKQSSLDSWSRQITGTPVCLYCMWGSGKPCNILDVAIWMFSCWSQRWPKGRRELTTVKEEIASCKGRSYRKLLQCIQWPQDGSIPMNRIEVYSNIITV